MRAARQRGGDPHHLPGDLAGAVGLRQCPQPGQRVPGAGTWGAVRGKLHAWPWISKSMQAGYSTHLVDPAPDWPGPPAAATRDRAACKTRRARAVGRGAFVGWRGRDRGACCGLPAIRAARHRHRRTLESPLAPAPGRVAGACARPCGFTPLQSAHGLANAFGGHVDPGQGPRTVSSADWRHGSRP